MFKIKLIKIIIFIFNQSVMNKTDRIRNWKSQGMRSDNWDIIHERYIKTNTCDDCGKIIEGSKKNLEHNHKTGEIRGIVCTKCNVITGVVEKNLNELLDQHFGVTDERICKSLTLITFKENYFKLEKKNRPMFCKTEKHPIFYKHNGQFIQDKNNYIAKEIDKKFKRRIYEECGKTSPVWVYKEFEPNYYDDLTINIKKMIIF